MHERSNSRTNPTHSDPLLSSVGSGEGGELNDSSEQLLRMGETHKDEGRAGPITWTDIGFLAHGLAFAARPLLKATAGVIDRHSLGPRGAWILNLIDADFVHPHQLADIFEIGRSLISAELARLTDAGLIVSTPGSDRRRTVLSLTETGRAALIEVRAQIDSILRNSLASYSSEEIRLCARMLESLHR